MSNLIVGATARGLPEGWSTRAYRPGLQPLFRMAERRGKPALLAHGNGSADCVGMALTTATVKRGHTYRFRAAFELGPGVTPNRNLLFRCYGPGANDGIHTYQRLPDGSGAGDTRIVWPGEGSVEVEVQVLFRLSARGKVWVRELSLEECEPVQARWVRVACTQGPSTLESCEAAAVEAGRRRVDILLLPEYMRGGRIAEPIQGPSFQFMSRMAAKHRMWVAGGIVRTDPATGLEFNTALLVDRNGELAGMYDKSHPYSPELNDEGISAGRAVPVFRTDFGTIGIMICYDSWFTDVAELLSLRGAEIILFPNAGFYRALMPARATDNRVRVVCSSLGNGYGVWDTVGREVTNPTGDTSHGGPPGVTFKDVEQREAGGMGVLLATLDLNCSPSPHWNGGSMLEAPGGRRNRRDQTHELLDEIKRERERWWELAEV